MSPVRRRAGRRIWAAAALAGLATLVTLRLLLIHANLADVYYWEEVYRLVAARELATGPQWPLAEYQADHYQGGSLAVAVLAAPIFSILGPSHAHLKLVPLAFTVATAVVWVVLLWRTAGPSSAALVAWLFAIAAPTPQIYQVLAMGSHAETSLFTALGFLLTLEILRRPRSRLLPALLGLVGGLGIWFCYTAATAVSVWALVWLAMSARGTVRRGAVPLTIGAAAGLAPWLWYNVTHEFRGLDRVRQLLIEPVAASSTERFGERAAALFAVDLPRSLGFPDGPAGVPGPEAWTYYVVLVLGGCAAVWLAATQHRTRSQLHRLAVLLALTPVVHLGSYLASTFRVDVEHGFIAYRFFMPLFPIGVAAVALAASAGFGRRSRSLMRAGAVTLLALGVYGTVTMLREHPTPGDARIDAERTAAFSAVGNILGLKYGRDLDRALALVARLDQDARTSALFGFGWALEELYERGEPWPRLASILARCPAGAERDAALNGLRWGIQRRERVTRRQANAGFRARYHRELHARIAALAVEVQTLGRTGGRHFVAGRYLPRRARSPSS